MAISLELGLEDASLFYFINIVIHYAWGRQFH